MKRAFKLFLTVAALAAFIPMFARGKTSALGEIGADVTEKLGTDADAEQSEEVKELGSAESGGGLAAARTEETPQNSEPPKLGTERENAVERLSFTAENVFSEGKYYTVNISGAKRSEPDTDITYVNGEPYGDFRLELSRGGESLGNLQIDVPSGDLFLIMDSAAEGLSYGCRLISGKREYSSEEYPDIIRLDFYRPSELEVPQYGRYFAVFEDRLTELPVYENGAKSAPLGTHLELRDAGFMVQHLCVSTPSKSLTVAKYEYRFNVEDRRLEKKRVRFYGWNV